MTNPQPPAESPAPSAPPAVSAPPASSAPPAPWAAPAPWAPPAVWPGPYGYAQPGPPPETTPTNGLAISSLILSVGGFFLLTCLGIGGLVGMAGAILGHVSRRQIRERDEEGDGLAIAGIIIGWIAAGIGLIIFSALGDLAFAP
ncbi:DUF4190 domain-containing protein [Melissospora conviva]|uniref:DUF4190 domain-containing protein n=1 Tax=Melissospora conviva TaxID=3388432 RepID=UPI003B7900D9